MLVCKARRPADFDDRAHTCTEFPGVFFSPKPPFHLLDQLEFEICFCEFSLPFQSQLHFVTLISVSRSTRAPSPSSLVRS